MPHGNIAAQKRWRSGPVTRASGWSGCCDRRRCRPLRKRPAPSACSRTIGHQQQHAVHHREHPFQLAAEVSAWPGMASGGANSRAVARQRIGLHCPQPEAAGRGGKDSSVRFRQAKLRARLPGVPDVSEQYCKHFFDTEARSVAAEAAFNSSDDMRIWTKLGPIYIHC